MLLTTLSPAHQTSRATTNVGALISLFGGAAFRAIWGEVSTWLNNRQEHAQEMERMKLQADLDAAKSAQQLNALKVQSDLGIKTIEVQHAAAMDQADADAFTLGLKAAGAPSGVKWIDGWNSAIRPAFATVALFIWLQLLHTHGWVAVAWDLDMVGSVVGFFFADRSLRHAGK